MRTCGIMLVKHGKIKVTFSRKKIAHRCITFALFRFCDYFLFFNKINILWNGVTFVKGKKKIFLVEDFFFLYSTKMIVLKLMS